MSYVIYEIKLEVLNSWSKSKWRNKRMFSYIFLDRSHISTASSLAQQNSVADFGDQTISNIGF